MLDPKKIKQQAKAEIELEDFREAVEKEKNHLRSKRWWHFPFKIVFIRR